MWWDHRCDGCDCSLSGAECFCSKLLETLYRCFSIHLLSFVCLTYSSPKVLLSVFGGEKGRTGLLQWPRLMTRGFVVSETSLSIVSDPILTSY